mmetsp:Transcript_19734/g.35052  ORF Transcript_19734/g.35052 Transcript_19734/m.35052 type:complete len:236 (-) Transcript_19734:69-776(-)
MLGIQMRSYRSSSERRSPLSFGVDFLPGLFLLLFDAATLLTAFGETPWRRSMSSAFRPDVVKPCSLSRTFSSATLQPSRFSSSQGPSCSAASRSRSMSSAFFPETGRLLALKCPFKALTVQPSKSSSISQDSASASSSAMIAASSLSTSCSLLPPTERSLSFKCCFNSATFRLLRSSVSMDLLAALRAKQGGAGKARCKGAKNASCGKNLSTRRIVAETATKRFERLRAVCILTA